MAEGSDISIDIVLKEQVKPALDALSSGIAEFTKTLSILTAQAKSAGDLIGKVGTQAEQAGQKVSVSVKPVEQLKTALTKEAEAAKGATTETGKFGAAVDKDSPRIRSNAREVEALVSSYNRFRQGITNAATTLQNQVRGLRSAKEGFADLRSGINDTVGALTSFKALAIGAVAVLGVFKAKSFIESIVGDAAQLDETLRKAASAVGALNESTTEKLREDLKRLSIEEGADIRALAEAAVGVIPDVGEEGIAEFLKVAQRFSEVAGGNVAQIADTLVFIIKGFGTEADDSSKSLSELASVISDKLFVAAREGNIAIGQLTGIVGLAAQQAEVLGISFDELLAAFTALGDVGVKPMRAFRVLSGVLAGVQEPSVKVVEAVERVNRAIPSLNLDFSRTGLATDGLAKFLGKLTVALKADDDLAKDLGINIREMGLIFKATANQGEALSGALAQIQGSGGEVNRAAEFILEGTEGKLRRISAVFAALKDDIAQTFIPAIDDFLENFKNGIEGFRNSFGGSLSAIRQAVGEVQASNLTDDQKKVALATLGDLQREVNKAGLLVLVEALKVAFITGARILGDLIFVAFAKGGLVLKNLILEALGKKTASTRAAQLEATESVLQRVIPNAEAIPQRIPTQVQTSEIIRAVQQSLVTAQVVSRGQPIPQQGERTFFAAETDKKILEFAKALTGTVRDLISELPEADRNALAASDAINPLTNEVRNLQQIAAQQPELFKKIVAATFRNQAEVLKENATRGGIDFPARGDISKTSAALREAKATGVATDTNVLVAQFRSDSALFIDSIAAISSALGAGFGTGGAGFSTSDFDNKRQISSSFDSGNQAQQPVALDILQRFAAGGNSLPGLDATSSLVEKAGVGGMSQREFLQELSKVQEERDAEEAVFREIIEAGIARAAKTAQDATRVFAALGKAKTTEDLQNLLVTLGKEAGDFAPVLQGFINIRSKTDDLEKAITKLGEGFGFVAIKGEDGLISIAKSADECSDAIEATNSTIKESASVAIDGLTETSEKVGTIQQRIAETAAESTMTLAKRFAQVEIERRKAIGSTVETRIANEIQTALKVADELKAQIALVRDDETAKRIGKDEAVTKIQGLRQRLTEQTQVILEFIPDDIAVFKSVDDISKRIDDLRERAANIKLLESALPSDAPDAAKATIRIDAVDLEAQLNAAAKDYANAIITLIRLGDKASERETVNVLRDLVSKDAAAAEKLIIEVTKRAAKVKQDALRTINKDEGAAKQSEAIVAELDRLVTAKADATAKGLTAEVDELNKDIAGKIATLLNTLQGDVPAELQTAYAKIVATLNNIQTATGDQAKSIIEQSSEELSRIIQVLFSLGNKIGKDLETAQEGFRKSEEAFKRSRDGRSQTVRVGEVVSQRLAIGPAVPEGNQSLIDQSAGATKAAFQASQQTGREIDFIIDKIKTLEGQLDVVRALQIGAEDEPQRQALLSQLTGLLDASEALLESKLQNAGVPFVGEDDITRAEVLARAQLQLLEVEAQRVPVLETVRQATEAQQVAQEKLANSQKLAAAAGTKQYATLEAVYGVVTFQIDKTKGSIDQQRLALQAYIAELEVIQARLQEALSLNPDLAGDIQPAIEDTKQSLETAKGDLGALGQGWGGAFGAGFKEGLGAADSEMEFLENLGRGAGQAIQSNLGTAIDNVIDGTQSLGEAFQQFVSDTLIEIGKLIIKMLILQAIQTALGGIGFFNDGGYVPEPAELNRGGVIPDLRQPRRWNGYNTGGAVNSDTPKQPNGGMMARIKAAVSRMKPMTPAPQPMFVRAFADGGFVGSDSLSKAMQTIVNVLAPTPREPRFYETGGFVARNADDTPSISNAVKAINRVFDPKSIQALNTGGMVEESGVGKVLRAISSVLKPKEPEVMALAGGGVAYLAVGGFPANAPRRQGRVPGPSVNRDVVPAMLTPGEFVMKRSAVSNYGLGVMYAMNEGIVPRDMFGSLPGVRKLATGGTAEATIPPKIEISTPMQAPTQMPQQQSGSQAPVPAYIVANEQAMQNLLNGGKNSMIDFMRRNKST